MCRASQARPPRPVPPASLHAAFSPAGPHQHGEQLQRPPHLLLILLPPQPPPSPAPSPLPWPPSRSRPLQTPLRRILPWGGNRQPRLSSEAEPHCPTSPKKSHHPSRSPSSFIHSAARSHRIHSARKHGPGSCTSSQHSAPQGERCGWGCLTLCAVFSPKTTPGDTNLLAEGLLNHGLQLQAPLCYLGQAVDVSPPDCNPTPPPSQKSPRQLEQKFKAQKKRAGQEKRDLCCSQGTGPKPPFIR